MTIATDKTPAKKPAPQNTQQTACPKCHSRFTFTRMHLEAAAGKVRCGHCMEVFVAREHLLAKPEIGRAQSETLNFNASSPSPAFAVLPAAKSRVNSINVQRRNGYTRAPTHQEGSRIAQGFRTLVIQDVFIWLPISILLVLFLIGQYMWVNFDQLAGKSSWQDAYRVMCSLFDCQLPKSKTISAIKSDGIKIYTSKPAQTRTLRASLTNQTYVAQDLPDILVKFKDINDNLVASGYYTAAHYSPYQQKTLKPNKSIDISLTFVDPGEEAINYSVEVFE